MRRFFVFDVESVGLYGSPFAVGWVVIQENGVQVEEGLLNCYSGTGSGMWLETNGHPEDVQWVLDHVPVMDLTHRNIAPMMHDFWGVYLRNKDCVFVADCPYPVEARFLNRLFGDNRVRQQHSPYPLLDVGSIAFTAGLDPLKSFERHPTELPLHNPLCDARQSARIMIEALDRIRKPIKDLMVWNHIYRRSLPCGLSPIVRELGPLVPEWDLPLVNAGTARLNKEGYP